MLYGFNPGFPRLFLCTGQIVHALLTRPPLSIFRKIYLVRLACVRHAASVRPEPGSNSRLIFLLKITHSIIFCLSLLLLFCSLIIELSKVSYAVLLSKFNAPFRELLQFNMLEICCQDVFLLFFCLFFLVIPKEQLLQFNTYFINCQLLF